VILGVRLLDVTGHWLAAHLPARVAWRATLAAALPGLLAAALVVVTALPAVGGSQRALGSLAGTGGLPGGREAGEWIDAHLPHGAALMTIGPTMSNLVEFYGHRSSQGLSVSTNPLHRNPAYDPIPNPDYAIRTLRIQYVVWDTWSASRSSHFSARLLAYASKYHGRLIYEQRARVRQPNGALVEQPVIEIYEVRP